MVVVLCIDYVLIILFVILSFIRSYHLPMCFLI